MPATWECPVSAARASWFPLYENSAEGERDLSGMPSHYSALAYRLRHAQARMPALQSNRLSLEFSQVSLKADGRRRAARCWPE